MKIKGYTFPKSSFLSTDKDMEIIIDRLLKDKDLKRLLFYTTKDCMSQPELTEQQTIEMCQKNIKRTPKIYVDNSVLNYIIISFDNFVTNNNNPEFRDNIVEIDVICHFNQWEINNSQLRPYRIAGHIDSLLNNTKLTGIGELKFLGANQLILNDEFAGLCLMYSAIHGEEDKKDTKDDLISPQVWEEIKENYNEMFN